MSLENVIVSQIKIISGHSIFNENAVVLSKKFGWSLEKEFNPKPKDLYIVFGAHELAHHLLEIQYRLGNTFGYVIMNSEQSDSQFMKNKYYVSLMKRNVVCDYNTLSANYLKETFDIKVMSYFYFEFMKFNLETKERPYDVCFIGSKNKRREKILKELQEKHTDLNFYIDFDWSHKNSDSLTKILHECKVVLNIPYYDKNALETHRIHKALACNCKVISLPSVDEDTNEFYKKYITITDSIDLSIEGIEPKYEDLIKELSSKFNQHLLFIVEQIHTKLLSL
jgi:hypothetical protein